MSVPVPVPVPVVAANEVEEVEAGAFAFAVADGEDGKEEVLEVDDSGEKDKDEENFGEDGRGE